MPLVRNEWKDIEVIMHKHEVSYRDSNGDLQEVSVPKWATIRFSVGPRYEDYVDVKVEGGVIVLRSGFGQMIVEPKACNVVEVREKA